MNLRMIEVSASNQATVSKARETLAACRCLQTADVSAGRNKRLFKALVRVVDSQSVIDKLEFDLRGESYSYQIAMLPVAVAVPSPDAEALDSKPMGRFERRNVVSREELVQLVEDSARPTPTFVGLVALSSIVAAIGLLEDSVEVLVGAMVIAPLLGPSIAASLATCLGQPYALLRSLGTGMLGAVLAFGLAFAAGALAPKLLAGITMEDGSAARLTRQQVRGRLMAVPAVASRTKVGTSSIVLALVTGTAGAMAFGAGAGSVLIGVMVAIALVPPLVTCGMLVGVEAYTEAGRAGLLTAANAVSLQLAATSTFLLMSLGPSRARWWEGRRADALSRRLMAVWLFALTAIAVLVWKLA